MSLAGTILKRSFSSTSVKNVINNVTVIGGGLMGSGIAQVAAQVGNNVTLVEVNPDLLKKAEASIQVNLTRVAKKLHKDDASAAKEFVEGSMSRIKGTTDPIKAVEDSDLVMEAIVEKLEIKQELFKKIDEVAPQKTILASNTSSLSIADIASVANRKDRFGGLHFFSPVPVMRLLEVIRISETTDETFDAMMAWGKAIGKTCICCKDTPGFVVNRLLVPYIAEAMRMLERGDATKEDIDTAMKLGAGYALGPFEVADMAGNDVALNVLEGWHKLYPNVELFKPVPLLQRMVAEGKLGRKTGEGFYKYTN